MKISEFKRFPLRTLMICFTTWLIVTEVLVVDEVKFKVSAELIDQAGRALVVPSERPSNPPSAASMGKL